MKKLLAIVLSVTMLAVAAGLGLGAGVGGVALASPGITVYADDEAGWQAAVGYWQTEDFTDATLNPGLSVVSEYPGYVDTVNGVWWDRLVCPGYGETNTTWLFDTPTYAFGGTWNPAVPGGPGANIAVAIDGSWVTVGEIPNTYENQFWGFVSTEAFSAVRLSPGSECNGAWCETYELDNMVYSSTMIYADDEAGWQAAVGCWETEDFADATLNPGLSVTPEWLNAGVTGGVWYDRLICPGEYDPDTGQWGPTTTTWEFAAPIYAFGGTWNPYIPGGPGANILVEIGGAWVTVGEIPNGYYNQFWGLVSTVPFSAVRLSSGSNCTIAWCETYELDNMVYTDITPPTVWSVETANPSGKNIPPAGSTTLPGAKGGMNEDGFYMLLATDNCDEDPEIYVMDGYGAVFGPFSNGTVVKFTEDPTVPPVCKKMGSDKGKAGYVIWHIILRTDAIVLAVDNYGNVGWEIQYVPPAPK